MITYQFPSIVIRCCCGIEEAEKLYPQNLTIDLTLRSDKNPEDIRALEDTIDYARFLIDFRKYLKGRYFPLIEDVAREINAFCRDNYSTLTGISYTITKQLSFPFCRTIIFRGENKL